MASEIERILAEKKPFIDEAIEQMLPRKFDNKSIALVAGKPRFAYDVQSISKSINEPVWNLLDRGGKRWRPALLLLTVEAFDKNWKKALPFAALVELVHNGTLIVDDIEDDSELRRGKQCVHKLFGVDVAVNAGNAIYFIPLAALFNNKDYSRETLGKAFRIYVQEMINVSIGQGMDIYWHRGKKESVSESEYLQMCAYKTGCLARMAAKTGAILAGADDKTVEKLGAFAEAVGIAFQIQDDVLNLVGEKFGSLKGVGEDIHEGKRTLIVLHALKHSKKAERLIAILNSHPSDEKTISEAISIMQEAGSIEYAKRKAAEMVKSAWLDAEKTLPPTEGKQKLRALADYLIEREI